MVKGFVLCITLLFSITAEALPLHLLEFYKPNVRPVSLIHFGTRWYSKKPAAENLSMIVSKTGIQNIGPLANRQNRRFLNPR